MGELLDRGIQRQLLEALSHEYPNWADSKDLAHFAPGNTLKVNIAYLHGHRLVEAKFFDDLARGKVFAMACITEKGLDFLADDGGLGAILGVQTIRLHQDTVRDLLIARVRESEADNSIKGKLVDQLKALPAEAVSKLAEKALEKAIHHMPNAIQWLQTAPWN